MKRNDFLLIAGVLVSVLLFLGLYFAIYSKSGAWVSVKVDGKEEKRLPLGQDTTYTITTEYGTNILEIRDGAAQIREADCPDLICVRQKAIKKQGETLVCLPHKVIVSVVSDEKGEMDSISR